MIDSSYQDPRDPNFTATGQMLAWRVGSETRFSILYRPTLETVTWDEPRANPEEVYAIGSRFGVFSYVTFKVTGRTLTRVTGTDLYGTRAQVVMGIDQTNLPEDRTQVSAWVVDRR